MSFWRILCAQRARRSTLVGDTTAIMLGSALNMSFTDFFWYLGKPSIFFAVELGAVKIVPVMTRRCVSRPDGEKFSRKLERLRKIALEAAKQSGRGIIPEVSGIISFEKCLDEVSALDLGLICYEKGGERLKEQKFPEGGKIGLIIGSEGGFDPEEAKSAVNRGIKPIWLGDRILRCETAPVAAISVIMNLTDNI